MLRWILGLCVVLGGALTGRTLAQSARRRADTLLEVGEGLRSLRIHMTGLFEPVKDALSRSSSPLLNAVGLEMAEGVSASRAWTSVEARERVRGRLIDALTDEDRRFLGQLFAGLGESGKAEQEALVNASIQAIERQLEAARAKAAEAEKLYLRLGILIGLMLALVVI